MRLRRLRDTRPLSRVADLDAVIFNHSVREQLLTHLRDLGLGRFGVVVRELDLDEFTLSDVFDAAEPESLEGVVDRLALRVQDPILKSYVDACFQRNRRQVGLLDGLGTLDILLP